MTSDEKVREVALSIMGIVRNPDTINKFQVQIAVERLNVALSEAREDGFQEGIRTERASNSGVTKYLLGKIEGRKAGLEEAKTIVEVNKRDWGKTVNKLTAKTRAL